MADITSTLASWSSTAGNNQPDNADAVGPNTLADNLRTIQAVVRDAVAGSGTIASATTTDLSTVNDSYIAVSGTTTITGLGTVSAGIVKFLKFDGALTFTHNATSLILFGSNITTAAGDIAVMRSEGSGNWRCLSFFPRAGVQTYDADLATIAGLTATTDNFIQSKSSAWASRTPTQVTADLIAVVGDSGAGGTKGLVPAPSAGDAAAGKYLKADGTWSAPGGGLTLGTMQTWSSGVAQGFTSLPAGLKQITVSFSGISTNGTSKIGLQIGDSGGYENTGYNGTTTQGTTRDAWSNCILIEVTNGAAAYAHHGAVTLTLMDASTNLWSVHGCVSLDTSTAGACVVSGTKALSATLDRIQITTTGGVDTGDGGTWNIAYQ